MSHRSHAHYDPEAAPQPEEDVCDFAFADTVVASDLDNIPPSGFSVVTTPNDAPPTLSPPSWPPPYPPAALDLLDAPVSDEDTSLWVRMRENVKATSEEMRLLWSATAEAEPHSLGSYPEQALARATTIGRRVRTMFSFFEWDRADILRATWIGLAVFVLAATLGAIVFQAS